jgi:hypothetical protein
MNPLIPAAGVAGAIVLAASGAVAPVHAASIYEEAGVPLAPREAAGAWTLQANGRPVCVLELGARRIAPGVFELRAPPSCNEALPAAVAGWAPESDGMSLVDAGGRSVIGFGRWSDSLLVSHYASLEDVQLERGG